MSSIIAVSLVLVISGMAIAAFIMCRNLVKRVDKQQSEINSLKDELARTSRIETHIITAMESMVILCDRLQSQINELKK